MTDEPLKAGDMDIVGNLFGIMFEDEPHGLQVILYIEDDGNFFPQSKFSAKWLPDLGAVVVAAMNRALEK